MKIMKNKGARVHFFLSFSFSPPYFNTWIDFLQRANLKHANKHFKRGELAHGKFCLKPPKDR